MLARCRPQDEAMALARNEEQAGASRATVTACNRAAAHAAAGDTAPNAVGGDEGDGATSVGNRNRATRIFKTDSCTSDCHHHDLSTRVIACRLPTRYNVQPIGWTSSRRTAWICTESVSREIHVSLSHDVSTFERWRIRYMILSEHIRFSSRNIHRAGAARSCTVAEHTVGEEHTAPGAARSKARPERNRPPSLRALPTATSPRHRYSSSSGSLGDNPSYGHAKLGRRDRANRRHRADLLRRHAIQIARVTLRKRQKRRRKQQPPRRR